MARTKIPLFEIGSLGAGMDYYDTSLRIFRALHQSGIPDIPEDPLDRADNLPPRGLVARYDRAILGADFLGQKESGDPYEVLEGIGYKEKNPNSCIERKKR